MAKEFNKYRNKVLNDRIKEFDRGITPKYTDTRQFFYYLRQRWIARTGDTTLGYTGNESIYGNFCSELIAWFKKTAISRGYTEETWWKLRDDINIDTNPKALVYELCDSYLVKRDNTEKVIADCSLLMICEKSALSQQILEEMIGKGYKIKVISTGGYANADTQKVISLIDDLMKNIVNPNFYILILHDYDLHGIFITSALKKIYSNVIDVGFTEESLKYFERVNTRFSRTLVEEDVFNSRDYSSIKDYMNSSNDYNVSEYDYLNGNAHTKQVKTKSITGWLGKRIELDAVHMSYGIEIIADYIEQKIENECQNWDLSRIGVDEFDLEEPKNEIERLLEEKENEIYDEFSNKEDDLNEPINVIWDSIKEKINKELYKTINKYWSCYWCYSTSRSLKEIDLLREKYEDQINVSLVDKYESELWDINDQIENYYGDVRLGEEDLNYQCSKLQNRIYNDARTPDRIDEVKKDIENVEGGLKDLNMVKVLSKKEILENIIEIATEMLKEEESK